MQTARVDLSKIDSTYIFNVMQEDTDRQIRIELFDDGELYEVSGDAVSVWYEGSSGDAGNFSEGIVKEANALIITLDEHMTKNPGKYTLAVMLTRAGGNISTWNMVVNVSPLPGRSRSAAEEYFGAFSLTSLASDLNALNTRVDNIVANAGDTGNNAELVDIRLGYDGTTYSTAGEAVRTQNANIVNTISKFEGQGYFSVPIDWKKGYYIRLTDGVDKNLTDSEVSDFILIPARSSEVVIIVSCFARDLACPVAFYDEKKNFISAYKNLNEGIINENIAQDIPENAKYFRVSNMFKPSDHNEYGWVGQGNARCDIISVKLSSYDSMFTKLQTNTDYINFIYESLVKTEKTNQISSTPIPRGTFGSFFTGDYVLKSINLHFNKSPIRYNIKILLFDNKSAGSVGRVIYEENDILGNEEHELKENIIVTQDHAIVVQADTSSSGSQYFYNSSYKEGSILKNIIAVEYSTNKLIKSTIPNGYIGMDFSYMVKKEIVEKDLVGDVANENNYLYKKKLIAIGDSMVYGHTLGPDRSWVKIISGRNKMTEVNLGKNGCFMCDVDAGDRDDSVYRRLCVSGSPLYVSDEVLENCDYFLVFAGTNDISQSIEIGEEGSEDPTNFTGAVNLICQTLQTRIPAAHIGFITPYLRKGKEQKTNQFIDVIENVCSKYSIPVFNNAKNGGICWSNDKIVSTLTLDSYHLNDLGMQFCSLKYESFLKSI